MNQIVRASRASLEPSTLSEAITFSQMLARSTMVPKDFQGRPENILVAVQWGREIGLGPLQALQNIAVINGRPSVWGDAMLALVRGSGLCAFVKESIEGEGEAMVAVCIAARRGEEQNATPVRFSVADARKAGLWSKAGPWTQYPKRMLQLRARGFALRDTFPDVLRGVITAEEARDIPEQTFNGPTIEARAEYPPPPTMGEQINDALPEHSAAPSKRMTWAELLDVIELEFAGAQTRAEVDAVHASERVQKALAGARNGTKERLDEIVMAAVERTAGVENAPENGQEDDGWPGPDPDKMPATRAAA